MSANVIFSISYKEVYTLLITPAEKDPKPCTSRGRVGSELAGTMSPVFLFFIQSLAWKNQSNILDLTLPKNVPSSFNFEITVSDVK